MQAQQAGADFDPLACKRCGCRRWRVYDSRPGEDVLQVRYRYCENCKETMEHHTEEVPVPKGFKIAIVPVDDVEDAA